jgi:hypothetical protein
MTCRSSKAYPPYVVFHAEETERRIFQFHTYFVRAWPLNRIVARHRQTLFCLLSFAAGSALYACEMAPDAAATLTEAEKLRRLAELQRRLARAGTALPDDFVCSAPDATLLRYLAARGFDVERALAVRERQAPRVLSRGRGRSSIGGAAAAQPRMLAAAFAGARVAVHVQTRAQSRCLPHEA